MHYPDRFPRDLRPNGPRSGRYIVPETESRDGQELLLDSLTLLEEAQRAHPHYDWPLRPGDDDRDRAMIYHALSPYLPGRRGADTPLPTRGDLSALTYAAVLHAFGELADLASYYHASPNELFGSHFAAAVSLGEAFTGARTARALSLSGVSSLGDTIDPEVEARYDAAYDSITFPARHPGESLTDLLVRLWNEADPDHDRTQAIRGRLALIEAAGWETVRDTLRSHWTTLRFHR